MLPGLRFLTSEAWVMTSFLQDHLGSVVLPDTISPWGFSSHGFFPTTLNAHCSFQLIHFLSTGIGQPGLSQACSVALPPTGHSWNTVCFSPDHLASFLTVFNSLSTYFSHGLDGRGSQDVEVMKTVFLPSERKAGNMVGGG